jgi:hypothetical protein
MKTQTERKKVFTDLKKQVGILGIIAIKNDLQRSGNGSFYKAIKHNSLGYTAQSLIFHHLRMVKDFAQYV